MARKKNENSPYERTMRRAEESMIRYAVECAGSLRKAAPLLGVSESFLITRAKALGVTPPKTVTTPKPPTPPVTPPADPEPDNVVQLPSRAAAGNELDDAPYEPESA